MLLPILFYSLSIFTLCGTFSHFYVIYSIYILSRTLGKLLCVAYRLKNLLMVFYNTVDCMNMLNYKTR